MDFKIKNLQDKVYSNFIKGVYGDPKIPNKDEVRSKVLDLTSSDPTVPVTQYGKMNDIDIESISSKFENVIDDIDVIFDSVEDESTAILDQLTNSLKEHNGAKREIQRINDRANDIAAGKLGTDYINYIFTENFNNLKNIDSFKSDKVDLESKNFTIGRNSSRVLTMDHYRGRKIEFSLVRTTARLIDYGYVGTTDAATFLDPEDSRSLIYRYKTNSPAKLRSAMSLQLTPTGEFIEINGLSITLDSRNNKGQIRLFYRGKDAAWHDVTPSSMRNIKGDKITFDFDEVITSHVKIEFIKDRPDISSSNEYFINLASLSIYRSTALSQAVLQSKPISIDSYSKEHPIIDSVKATMDIETPRGTTYELSVAKDIKISGAFKDYNGNVISHDSPNKYIFDSDYSGFVYLSDLLNVPETVSGVAIYKSMDYQWIPLERQDNTGTNKSHSVNFNVSSPINKIDNSIFEFGAPAYRFGDSRYTGPWPTGAGDWYLSGWCNSDNTYWDSYLSGYVASGILVSGVNVASLVGVPYTGIEDEYGNLHPDISGHPLYSGQWLGYGSGIGYPFNYKVNSSTIKFGEIAKSINGWWRPASEAVGPYGLKEGYTDSNGSLTDLYKSNIPDFYFNGINYWKIYKFGTTENVISPSIKVYTYQERPLFGSDTYYPHSFKWNYKSSWNVKTARATELSSAVDDSSSFDGYTISLDELFSDNEEYIFDSISEIRVHNTNVVLNSEDYILRPMSSIPTSIDFTPLVTNRPNLVPQGLSFDITYSYKERNRYQSTWTGYAIVSSANRESSISIPNINIYNKKDVPIINKIVVEDLDDGTIETIEATDDIFIVPFSKTPEDRMAKHYKLTIFCASDESTGFSALYDKDTRWIPFSSPKRSTINVDNGIKIVPNLSPLKIVDLASLVYDSSIYNSRKAALYSNLSNERFIVVRQPSKDIFPGYYFDSIKKQYKESVAVTKIPNKGHWIRQSIDNNFDVFTYTTGSSGINPGKIYNTAEDAANGIVDSTWNNGSCLTKYPNMSGGVYFPLHSTYGYPINIDDSARRYENDTVFEGDVDHRAPTLKEGYVGSSENLAWLYSNYPAQYSGYIIKKNSYGRGFYSYDADVDNKGFLYYNTAENLPSYYSISYKVIKEEQDNDSRFLYKLVLNGDNDTNLNPIVKSIKFKINEE